MTPAAYGRYLLRDSRGARGRLALFALCLAFGVAAIVAVAALAEGLDRGVQREAKQLLGGDLRASSRQPLLRPLSETLSGREALRTTDLREMLTMVAAPRRDQAGIASRLVELAVVEPNYPLYGSLVTKPDAGLSDLLADRGLVVAPELAGQLDLSIGDPLLVGDQEFTVRALLVEEPGHALNPFQIGPRVLMADRDFAATGLEAFGSRIQYRRFFRLGRDGEDATPATEAIETLADTLRQELEATSQPVAITSYLDAQNGLRDSLERLERFLGLIALLALVIGGVGVAQSVRSFLESRLDAIATAKCLGLRPREAFTLYFGQTLLLSLVASILGGLAGLGLQLLVPHVLGGLVSPDLLQYWRPQALAQGLLLGLVTSLGFALPPLLSVLSVPPLRALRRDAEPLVQPLSWRLGTIAVAVTALLVAAAVQARQLALAIPFTLGLLAAGLLLYLGARGLRSFAARLRHLQVLPLAFRQGAARLSTPGGTVAATTALGLGTFVVLTTVLVQQHLTTQLEADLPRGAPGTFLIGVQPDQWPEIEAELVGAGATNIDSVPEIMARLRSVDGRSVQELAAEASEDERWALVREQRLTYLEAPPTDNEIVAGAWWSDRNASEISLEEEFASELGAGLGSRLTFDVQGVPLDLVVTSLRRVDWQTFRINFFLVVAPGVLEAAPQSRLAAATLPPGREQMLQDRLTRSYPNVTFIDVRAMLRRVSEILERLGLGVRVLGIFTALAGLIILFGAVAATSLHRANDLALLRALGFSRRQAASVLLAEQGLTGLVAGVLGSLTAGVASWIVATHALNVDFHLFPTTHLLVVGAILATTCLAGTLTGVDALRRSPAEVFRHETQ